MRLAIFVLVLLLGTAASARALPDAAEAGAPPTTKVSLALADQDVVADIESALASNGRIPNTGGAPQQRTADLQLQLPLAPDQRWVLWMARDPVDMVRVTGLDGTIQTKGFFYAA